jgi:hypothetical protein
VEVPFLTSSRYSSEKFLEGIELGGKEAVAQSESTYMPSQLWLKPYEFEEGAENFNMATDQ